MLELLVVQISCWTIWCDSDLTTMRTATPTASGLDIDSNRKAIAPLT